MDNEIQPLPFEEWPTDSDITIRTCKRMINVMFKWKAKGPDATGAIYDPIKNAQKLGKSLAILHWNKIITNSQAEGIIKHLNG